MTWVCVCVPCSAVGSVGRFDDRERRRVLRYNGNLSHAKVRPGVEGLFTGRGLRSHCHNAGQLQCKQAGTEWEWEERHAPGSRCVHLSLSLSRSLFLCLQYVLSEFGNTIDVIYSSVVNMGVFTPTVGFLVSTSDYTQVWPTNFMQSSLTGSAIRFELKPAI
jgi:hypothetical protein